MASASDPPAHTALQPADRLILPPQQPPAAVETSIGPPHYLAECTQSDAFVQPSLRARKGHSNSDSFSALASRRRVWQSQTLRANRAPETSASVFWVSASLFFLSLPCAPARTQARSSL